MSDASPHDAAKLPCIPGLELQEKVGEGGMSAVYRAVHLNLQREVAVKLLRTPAEEDVAGPAWLHESRLMASLAHPHVVTIHDAGQVNGHRYLVMEYMGGGSLRSRMRSGRPWPLAQAAAVLDRVAQALEYIHERGVLHLDLKPENILYTADGQVKITDFGLSVSSARPDGPLADEGFGGTVDYCAPERRSGLTLDRRADVFALATLAYELLTGRPPGRVYIPASRRNPRLPAALDDVLRRGLARDPKERYPSVADFRQALAAACRPIRRRARVRLLGAAAGVVALIVLFVIIGWRVGTRTGAPPSPELPARMWVLYDNPEDLSLFVGEGGRELASGSGVTAEQVPVEDPPRDLPPGLALPVWPTPRPALVVRSPRAWGFVHPLTDRALARQVVSNWLNLLQMAVPAEKNFVKAGGFDGDCLATNHRGDLWRVGSTASWNAARRITLDPPPGQPDNPALLLTNLAPAPDQSLLGCYQPLARGPRPGAAVVLRYRARSRHGRGSLAVYAGIPVVIPEGDTGPIASRIRRLEPPLPPEADDPLPNRWVYRSPDWVTPSQDWQTYLVVTESPPFPARVVHRNLVIDVAAADEVWVDDVELFEWQPGGEP
jgi:hypothetical protein